jgi:hypothetical protein
MGVHAGKEYKEYYLLNHQHFYLPLLLYTSANINTAKKANNIFCFDLVAISWASQGASRLYLDTAGLGQ